MKFLCIFCFYIMLLAATSLSVVADVNLREWEALRDDKEFVDNPMFVKLTHKISKKLGMVNDDAILPKEQELHHFINSIIRTRHKYSGKACLGKHGIINWYVGAERDLERLDQRNHVAAIMAIDALVKLAIKDEDFSNAWTAQAENEPLSDEWVEKVLATLNDGQFGWSQEKVSSPFELSWPKRKQTAKPATEKIANSVAVIQGYHNVRREVFNAPLNEGVVAGKWVPHKQMIDQKTRAIHTILNDKKRVNPKRHANNAERRVIFQAVMGAQITDYHHYTEALDLERQLPGMRSTEPLYKHFEILRLTEQLSRRLMRYIEKNGLNNLEAVIGDYNYRKLFNYSGVSSDLFLDWFGEVFAQHKVGLIAATKRFDIADFTNTVRTVLVKRTDLVRLSGDIYDMYAPKLDLNMVYNEVMPSGGVYRGWNVQQADAFVNVINLTDKENEANPERKKVHWGYDFSSNQSYQYVIKIPSLQTTLRNEFYESMGSRPYELFSTYHKGTLKNDDDTEINVRYLYDHCLVDRDVGVVGKGAVQFYVTRKFKPELKHIADKRRSLKTDKFICDLYRFVLACNVVDGYESLHERGLPLQIYHYANVSYTSKRNPAQIIKLYREAIDFGIEQAMLELSEVLNNGAAWLFNDRYTSARELGEALDWVKESAALGCAVAKNNLPHVLNVYAQRLLKENKDIDEAISLTLEALALGNKAAFESLKNCAYRLIKGQGISRDISRALNLFQDYVNTYPLDKTEVASVLNTYGYYFFNGFDVFSKDIDKAIRFFEKAEEFGDAHAGKNLVLCAKKLIMGQDVKRDIQRGINLLKVAIKKRWDTKQNIAASINGLGAAFYNGTEGFELNKKIGTELITEASKLGDPTACNNLALFAAIKGR